MCVCLYPCQEGGVERGWGWGWVSPDLREAADCHSGCNSLAIPKNYFQLPGGPGTTFSLLLLSPYGRATRCSKRIPKLFVYPFNKFLSFIHTRGVVVLMHVFGSEPLLCSQSLLGTLAPAVKVALAVTRCHGGRSRGLFLLRNWHGFPILVGPVWGT